ncbi:hypothetical protein KFL_000950060 [Klebsormidium nitens]|uniref:DUF5745 domain-containing protein n=1 Tax=Klebsormidium nitens TaxID=105231 RepID=A0A1Y1HY88_KLENI|nr:hypothetical protein KFL_000950060 [Klebsormidium nitens]|eukprot:GAQ81931.1 hypothetical protein KFL_000950060 [Klebsormidium nitens]
MAKHHAYFEGGGSTLDGAELVALCNMMMAAAGLVAKAQTVDDVVAICSSTSVFVAAFEQLTGLRIAGLQQSPKSSADRVGNCASVIQEAAKFLELDLSHVKAERIVFGDQEHIASLLELIVAIPKRRLEATGEKKKYQTRGDRVDRMGRESYRTRSSKRGGGEEPRVSSGQVTEVEASEHWETESSGSDSSTQVEASAVWRRNAGRKLQRESTSDPQKGRHTSTRKDRGPRLNSEEMNTDSSEEESVHHPASDGAETGSDSADTSSSSSEPGKRSRCPIQGPSSYARIHSDLMSRGRVQPHPSKHFQATCPPYSSAEPPSVEPTRCDTSRDQESDSRKSGDVSTRSADVSKVLSLVTRVAREEQREWERKQTAFRHQLQSISRRAYAVRWPFRPLPDVRKIPLTAGGTGVRSWRREEDERLRKRRTRLVALRPRVGAQTGAGMVRCRKAYNSFLPKGQQVPLRVRPEPNPTSSGTNPLFSKETLKQLNDVIQSPVSTLDGGRAQTPNLQTLLRNHPELRKLLVGRRLESDGEETEVLVEGLPLNPGLRKGLAEKFAGLKELKKGSEVEGRPEEVSDEATWRHVEAWAEGLVPRSQPKMRGLARARLRGRLEAHQRKLQQIHAERFRAEAEADQKAAAVKKAEAEERLVKTLLERALALERESILAQRKKERERKAAEQRSRNADKERAEADIRARCALLKEEIQAKRRERMEIERAQEQVMRQLAREERERLELERAMLLERLAVQAR